MEKNLETMIEGLKQAVEMEKTLQDYYKQAERASTNSAAAAMMDTMEERHLSLAGRMGRRLEELEREGGEGGLADTLQAIGRAISDTVAGLPVGLIRTETKPSIDFLLQSEQQLLNHYEGLLNTVDPETLALLEVAAMSTRENIERLGAGV